MHLQPNLSASDIDRYWSKVDKRGPDDCWLWTAKKDPDGYGRLRLPTCTIRAHRIAFFLAHGAWADGLVCHTCDNPPCQNPAHLFDGSIADNTHDMVRKGRNRGPQKGEKHHSSKLTDDIVSGILLALHQGESQRSIAGRLGISQSIISHVALGKSWTHVPRPNGYRVPKMSRRVISEDMARELWSAIDTETVAYTAYQESGGACDPENIDYHNWSVSKDILEETFERVTGHKPEDWW